MTISWPGGVIIITTWSALYFRGVSGMDLDPAQLELDVLFGAGRMDPFMHRTRNDIAKAQRAYIWNAAVASKYLARVGFVEVGLRNILDGSLVHITGSDRWWEDFYPKLSQYCQKSIDRTLQYNDFAGDYPRDQFIAKSDFGLWTALLHKDNAKSLTQLANHAFSAKRGEIYHCMNSVRHLRNRAAHHVCLLGDNHEAHLHQIEVALDYIDRDLRRFINEADNLRDLLSNYGTFLAGKCHL